MAGPARGDRRGPLQLEPVTSLSLPAQQHLRAHFGVEERWLPARTSVQALADSVTPLGTLLERAEEEPLWVGAPLRVHRRCDDPMFTISNLVAYDGMMVYGTPPRADLGLPQSQWVNVPAPGPGSPDHWRPAEGEALKWLLDGLQRREYPMEDVFVLAPFRAVATQVGRIARRFGVPSKRRLYVIGDHAAWADRHHFQTLGRHLPLRGSSGG